MSGDDFGKDSLLGHGGEAAAAAVAAAARVGLRRRLHQVLDL